ncbi:MAG TPA: alpha/beta fold hydrolase [Thermoanaerobaculia bacterium]|nr:alpha/beta fold hydrolase [Thermoanaerobaculia bacterium]
MNRRIIAVMLALFAFACATPQGSDRNEDGLRDTPVGRYGGALGDSPVGVIPDVTLHDDARNKDYQISIEYPTRGTNAPLIIFSPGFGGSNDSYVGLSSYWTSNGYVVIRTSHADSNRVPQAANAAEVWATQTQSEWRNRVRDVTFIIDSLDTLEQRFPELQGKIDHAKIGVGGHSYGAFTALLLGGVKTFPGGTSYADPRVKAVVAMSPQGPGELRGLTNESFTSLTMPALFMTGTKDSGVTDAETPEWRREAFTLSPAGDKWLVVLEGARHASFTGRMEDLIASVRMENERINSDPTPTRDTIRALPPETGRNRTMLSANERNIFARVKGFSLAFWDLYLKGDAKGREGLETQTSAATVETK